MGCVIGMHASGGIGHSNAASVHGTRRSPRAFDHQTRLWHDVRAAILERADTSAVCAAVAAARGRRDAAHTDIMDETVVAFFATLASVVWDALGCAAQQRRVQALDASTISLAVRSLGLRTDILAWARIDNDLVHAAWRHATVSSAARKALLTVALRDLDPIAAHAVIAALPPPLDAGAFFWIACMHGGPAIIDPA